MYEEKHQSSCPFDSLSKRRSSENRRKLLCGKILVAGISCGVILGFYLCYGRLLGWPNSRVLPGFVFDRSQFVAEPHSQSDVCPQYDALFPSKGAEIWRELDEVFSDADFIPKAVEILGGAVRIPTESFDVMGPVGEDPRWESFGVFNEYLETTFPLINSTLLRTKVNHHALIYEWEGSATSYKPLLLAAHQDVVPVDPNTVDQWVYPPYSGHFDGKKIWGRGSMDDKSGLIGIMAAVESLLEKGFVPTRKVVLAFGIDEEATGRYGAKRLAEHMLAKYGRNSFSMLVDEGGGLGAGYGGKIAMPGTAEKGSLDAMIEVHSPGGHSSVPPAHTSIGMLASLIVRLEENPFSHNLTRITPLYSTLQCIGEHSPELPDALRELIRRSISSDDALYQLQDFVKKEPLLSSLITTTQAVDLVGGGVKVNALPEKAWAVVNHRISTDSSVKEVQEHDTSVLEEIASKFNLSFAAFGRSVGPQDAPSYGSLILSEAFDSALEPAPITPTGSDAAPYRLLSRTIRATYISGRHNDNDGQLTVSPFMIGGNTDTQFYWDLTEHIFRYNHVSGDPKDFGGVHTVNEAMNANAFVEMIRFFVALILNADESTDI